LATAELGPVAEARGLVPYAGFLDTAGRGRASLAPDLLEPYRGTLVERFTSRLNKERVLRIRDFQMADVRGNVEMQLTESGCLRLLGHDGEAMMKPPAGRSMRWLMGSLVDRLAMALDQSGAAMAGLDDQGGRHSRDAIEAGDPGEGPRSRREAMSGDGIPDLL
jgi:hypothetical protein